MAEEYIDDIIAGSEVPKTEAEMAAEIQGSDDDKVPEEKAAEKQPESSDDKSRMEAEGRPAVVQNGDKVKDDKTVAPDVDPVKELASQLGWREDHTGDDAVDAKTYILRSKDIQKSMSQHNKDLKDQLHGLSGSVEALKLHNESVYQAEVKRLTSEVGALKKERKAAIELADVVKVEELDKQIDDIQKDINNPLEAKTQDANIVTNPVFDEWVENNQWYLKDDEMANFADNVAQQYNGAPLERIYALVKNKVQEVFPDKFEQAKPAESKQVDIVKSPVGPKSPVERSSAKGSEGSFTKADLTSEQVQIMKQFVQTGIMTEDQYVNDIAKMQ